MQTITQLAQDWSGSGALGLALIAFAFFVGSFVFIPRPALCLIGGLIFGFIAVPIALVASTLGAVSAFLLSRYVCRSFFMRRIEHRPIWKAVVDAIDAEGWKVVGLLRLASPIPGTAANYLLGLTGIGVAPFALATLLGQLPQVFLFVYLGVVGSMALQDSAELSLRAPLLAAGLLMTALMVVLVTHRTRVILAKRSIA